MASMKIYRVVTLTPSVAHSIVSGTTAAATVPASPDDKGVEVTFQNQSTGAVNVYIGPSGFAPSIGTTSTTGTGGIVIAQNGTFSLGHRHAPSAIQMNDFYIASTSSNAVVTAFLLKAV